MSKHFFIVTFSLLLIGCTHYHETAYRSSRALNELQASCSTLVIVNQYNRIPHKTRRALRQCDYTFGKDPSYQFYQAAYTPDQHYACFLYRSRDTAVKTNSVLFVTLAGDSLEPFLFTIADSVKTVASALANVTFQNQDLFGGGIMSKRQERKYARRQRRSYRQRSNPFRW